MGGRHEDTGATTLRAPVGHRLVSAVACPVVGYLIARLLVRFIPELPEVQTYAVALAVALLVAVRAWRSRIELRDRNVRVRNTLATTTIDRRHVQRVSAKGRVEWRRGGGRRTRLPSEALRGPWWALGTGRKRYVANRERLASWVRTSPRAVVDEPPDAAVA